MSDNRTLEEKLAVMQRIDEIQAMAAANPMIRWQQGLARELKKDHREIIQFLLNEIKIREGTTSELVESRQKMITYVANTVGFSMKQTQLGDELDAAADAMVNLFGDYPFENLKHDELPTFDQFFEVVHRITLAHNEWYWLHHPKEKEEYEQECAEKERLRLEENKS